MSCDATREEHSKKKRYGETMLQKLCFFSLCRSLNLNHLPQVDDEAVSFVEAGPGKVHLRSSDPPTTLNVQQPLDVHLVGHHMLEA